MQLDFEGQRMPRFFLHGTNTQFNQTSFAESAVLHVAGWGGTGLTTQNAEKFRLTRRHDLLGNVVYNNWYLTGIS
jgi:hypothetical protein